MGYLTTMHSIRFLIIHLHAVTEFIKLCINNLFPPLHSLILIGLQEFKDCRIHLFSGISTCPKIKTHSQHREQIEWHYNGVHIPVLVVNNSTRKFPLDLCIVLKEWKKQKILTSYVPLQIIFHIVNIWRILVLIHRVADQLWLKASKLICFKVCVFCYLVYCCCKKPMNKDCHVSGLVRRKMRKNRDLKNWRRLCHHTFWVLNDFKCILQCFIRKVCSC